MRKSRAGQKGFALQVALLIVLVLLPLAAMLVSWLKIHYQHNVNTKLDAKLYYQNKSAVDKARYEIFQENAAVGGRDWSKGMARNFEMALDAETTVEVEIRHRGFDPLSPDSADVQ